MTTDGEGERHSADSAELSLDAVLDALSHHHRRTLLRWLRKRSDRYLGVNDLVDHLIEQETERTGQTPNSDHIELALHHIHGPKLSNAGLLTYHEDAEEYEYHPDDRLEKWLDLIDSEHDSEW